MKVAEPRVSTASRLRTRALRPAIRWALRASERVTVGSRPSGTNATVTPIAKRNASVHLVPTSQETAKKASPTPTDSIDIHRTMRSSSRVNGLRGGLAWLASTAISASRVAEPVAVTRPSASPVTRKVPPAAGSPSALVTGTLSPVSMDSSTRQPAATISVRSAGTRSPAARTTTSPGTMSVAATESIRPSRRTVTRLGIRAPRRAAARSARAACSQANRPLTRTTTTIAIASCGRPAKPARTAAPHSIKANRWVISVARAVHHGGGLTRGSSLAP